MENPLLLDRFNPCFNGTYSLTRGLPKCAITLKFCFNPCFNGTYSLTDVIKLVENQEGVF